MSAEDLSTLFELLPIGAYRATMCGKVLRVNEALARLHGFAHVEEMQAAMGGSFADPYRSPTRRDEFKALLTANGQVKNFESEMVRHRTGGAMWAREHAHIVRAADGSILYYEGTVEDISEERQAKAALLQREALLQNLLQTIPDSIWLKDIDGTYLTCNEAFAKTCGTPMSGIVGKQDKDWVHYADAAGFRATDELAIRHRKPVVFEEEFGLPGGALSGLHELVKAPMYDSMGNTIGVLGMARNIQQRKWAETQLRETTEKLELALIGADLGLWEHDLTTERGYSIDASSWNMLGYRDEHLHKHEWVHLMHPEDVPEALATLRAYLIGTSDTFEVEYRALHASGQWTWISSRGKVVQTRSDGTPLRMVGTLMDVTARKWSEQQLRAAQADLQATLNALPDLLFEVSAEGMHRAVHARDISLLTVPPAYVIDKTVHDLLPAHAAEVWMLAIDDAKKTGRSNGRQYSLELRGQTHWFELSLVRKPTERGEEQRFIAVARDITERKIMGDAIAHLAFHDALTGLPNRRLLNERLQRAVTSSNRSGQYAALMFIDLDRFKALNDTHGHEMGDLLLVEVARRLRLSVRESDTVARLGGDEFVVLIQDLTPDAQQALAHAQAVGQKILDNLNADYDLKGVVHKSTPSIGATLFAGEALHYADILQRADAAMYSAKAAGRNALRFYQESSP